MRRLAGFALIAALLLIHVLTVVLTAERPMHYDENEALHASWLTAAGKRLYRDFFEEHPPHYFAMLRAVMPSAPPAQVDVHAWTLRARAMSGLFGMATLLAVMLYAWRMTRSLAAPAIAGSALMASWLLWLRALGDARNDVPALTLLWIGIVLIVWQREPSRAQSLRAGLGIGLMFLGALVNLKWPLECVVMGVVFLDYVRRARNVRIAAIIPAIAMAILAIVPILTDTTLADFLFFSIRLKFQGAVEFAQTSWVPAYFARQPMNVVAWTDWVVLAAIAAIAFLPLRETVDKRLVRIALALLAASMIEVRFLYTYPYVWRQYLAMLVASPGLLMSLLPLVRLRLPKLAPLVLSIAAALCLIVYAWFATSGIAFALACVIALVALSPRDLATTFAAAAVVIVIAAHSGSLWPSRGTRWQSYWTQQHALQASLREGDTVWIAPPRHPVAAFDASYYWYAFKEAAPIAIRVRERFPQFLPPIGFGDLPPCTLPESMRYILLTSPRELDGVCKCVERAWSDGKLAPTPYLALFELHAPPRPAPMWLRSTASVWPDFCATGGLDDDRVALGW